ncbi:MAG: hypothetical protein NTV07_02330 [Candidatus Omnitrophica bacterium]|nr:hypothetical protein [Candidatus Omnitrophota bacterium]
MIKAQLLLLCEEVSGRLRAGGLKGRTITLKIRLEGFQTYTRAITIDRAINFVDSIYKEIIVLYDNFDKRNKRVRLVGVRVSGLCLAAQRDSLFGDDAEKEIESIHKAVDRIRQRFGGEAIHRAGSVTKRTER